MGEQMLIAGLLVSAAIATASLAGRLRVPSLVVFLGVGMAVGTDGLGWIAFDDYELARDVGIVAVALILLEGGLTTDVAQLRRVAGIAASLSLVTTLLTGLVTGVAASWVFDLSLLEGMLLGGIVASTDAAATFALLRGTGLQPRIQRLLEGEAASNDPVAILLVIGFIEWIQRPDYGPLDMAGLFAEQMAIGIAVGVAGGLLAVRVLRAAALPSPGLYAVVVLSLGAVVFGTADVLGGSGFLAIYLTGLAVSGSILPAKRAIVAFHEGLAWVAQLAIFLMLGLLVFPSQLGDIAVEGTILALVIIFVARPVASTAATLFVKLSLRERLFLGWAGLRGAVPVVLATYPVIAGVPGSVPFFNVIFFAVIVSLLIQGPTIEPLARRLGLVSTIPVLPEPIAEIGTIRGLGAEIIEYVVSDGHAIAGRRIRDLGLPREAVVNIIVRGDEALPPRGTTRIEPGDHLHLLVRLEASDAIALLTQRWRDGPIDVPRAPRRTVRSFTPVFSVRTADGTTVEGALSDPQRVVGREVVARLRERRDAPGALVALADSRYALTSPLLVIGSRRDLSGWIRRRLPRSSHDERFWLQAVVGELAVDTFAAPAGTGDEDPDGGPVSPRRV